MIDLTRLQRKVRARRYVPDAFWLNALLDAKVWPAGMSVDTGGNLVIPEMEVTLTRADSHLLNHTSLVKNLLEEGSLRFSRSGDGPLLVHTLRQDGMEPVTAEIATATDFVTFDEVVVHLPYRAHCLKPAVVCDIGMNVGLASLAFAAQPDVLAVYGYEPVPPSYQQALRNFARNPQIAAKIKAFPYGVDAVSRSAEIPYSAENLTSAGLYTQVRPSAGRIAAPETAKVELRAAADIMDDIWRKHPDSPLIVKMDCEGAEKDIIPALDAAGWLKRLDMAVIETHFRDTTEIVSLLTGAGMRLFQTVVDVPIGLGLIYAAR